jgi:hypothetical protein
MPGLPAAGGSAHPSHASSNQDAHFCPATLAPAPAEKADAWDGSGRMQVLSCRLGVAALDGPGVTSNAQSAFTLFHDPGTRGVINRSRSELISPNASVNNVL